MNLGGRSFRDLVEDGQITEDVYRYSGAGRSLFNAGRVWDKIMLVVGGITAVITLIVYWSCVGLNALNLEDADFLREGALKINVSNFDIDLDSVKNVSERVLLSVALVWLLVRLALLVAYFVVATRRWAYHERKVLSNDRLARRIRKQAISQLDIKKKIRNISKKDNPSDRESDSLEAYGRLMGMTVSCHSRESIMTGEIVRRCLVKIDTSTSDDVLSVMEPYLKKLGATLTRACRGRLKFGDGLASDDWTYITYEANTLDKKETAKHNKQLAKISPDTKPVGDDIYETSFDVRLLVDKSDEVTRKKEEASKWAVKNAALLSRILASGEQRAEPLSTVVTAAAITFDYDLPFSMDMSSTDNFQDAIRRVFKDKSASCEVADGNLRIVLSLPDSMRVGICNRSLYIKSFGCAPASSGEKVNSHV